MSVLCAAALGILLSGADKERAHALALEAFADGVPAGCPRLEVCYFILAITHWGVGQVDDALEVLTEGRRVLCAMGAGAAALAQVQAGLAVLYTLGDDVELARAQTARTSAWPTPPRVRRSWRWHSKTLPA